MKCNSRTMLSTALALGIAAVTAYLAFPAAQTFIVANAPLLVALVCPVSMLLMMWTVRGANKEREAGGEERASPPRVGEMPSGRF